MITNIADRRTLERNVLKSILEDTDLQKKNVLESLQSGDLETGEFREIFFEVQRAVLSGKVYNFAESQHPNAISEILSDGVSLNGELSLMMERLKSHRFSDESNLSELGLAKRFCDQHAGVKFNHTDKTFLNFEDGYWKKDKSGAVNRLMEKTVGTLYSEAERQSDGEQRKRIAAYALRAESKATNQNAVELVKHQAGVAITSEMLDRDPYLVNVENGTLDLRNGELRPHNHTDLITKQMPVVYNPDAPFEGGWWDNFLEQVFHDRELIGFMQRSFGYMLSGLVNEQYLWFLYGLGANGKSTFTKILFEIFGDYHQIAPSSLMLLKKNDGASPDVARLRGARVVVAYEIESGRRLAESLVKQLTGGDRLVARHLYAGYEEFEPTHKLILVANHRPRIVGTDDAIWRRMLLIPFEEQIPVAERVEQGKLLERARKEAPAILNWLIEGWQVYRSNGLMIPERVRVATKRYREESDTLAAFIEECCHRHGEVPTGALYDEFVRWTGDQQVSSRMFIENLKERGLELRSGHGRKRFWVGLSLRDGEHGEHGEAKSQTFPREGGNK